MYTQGIRFAGVKLVDKPQHPHFNLGTTCLDASKEHDFVGNIEQDDRLHYRNYQPNLSQGKLIAVSPVPTTEASQKRQMMIVTGSEAYTLQFIERLEEIARPIVDEIYQEPKYEVLRDFLTDVFGNSFRDGELSTRVRTLVSSQEYDGNERAPENMRALNPTFNPNTNPVVQGESIVDDESLRKNLAYLYGGLDEIKNKISLLSQQVGILDHTASSQEIESYINDVQSQLLSVLKGEEAGGRETLTATEAPVEPVIELSEDRARPLESTAEEEPKISLGLRLIGKGWLW